MGFPESLPTISVSHSAWPLCIQTDKPYLVEHWRQPNAYSTHSFLPFPLSHPQTGWLDQSSLTHTTVRLWSGPLQHLQSAQHNLQCMDASFDGLKRNPSLREESSHGTSVEKSRVLSAREKYGNGFSSITIWERHGRRGGLRGAKGRSKQSGSCLHWLQNVDPDSSDVSLVCIRYTDVEVDALVCLQEKTVDGNGQVSSGRGKAHVMCGFVCLLGDSYGWVLVCFHL